MIKEAIVGVDIAKESFDVAIKQGEKYKDKKFPNSEKGYADLSNWMKSLGIEKAICCMEATNVYWEDLANYLYNKGLEVSVVNPSKIEAYGRSQMSRNKTDKADARLIAEYCLAMKLLKKLRLYTPTREEVKKVQDLERHLQSLKEQKTQISNRLKTQKNPLVIKSINRVIENMEEEIVTVENMIVEEIEKDQKLKKNNELLMSIAGIAQTTAAIIIGEVGDIERFDSVKQLDAFAGLSPSEHSSGTSVKKKPRLSKKGNSFLRKALYFPAMTAMQHNPIVKAFSQRLKDKGKVPMSVLGAAMRKLLHLAFGVLKNQTPFDPNFGALPS